MLIYRRCATKISSLPQFTRAKHCLFRIRMAFQSKMGIMDFVQRFQSLQLHRDSCDELLKDLLIYCERVENGLRMENTRLSKELENAHLDLDYAQRSRRDLQQQLNSAHQKLSQSSLDCESIRNRNQYIMVLIDGDGMIFNEELVSQGIEGGKKAASLLREAVLKNCNMATDQIEVIAKVCANVTGLSKALKRNGCTENTEIMRDFTLGFTQGKASFDFIDVGHGKERADSKIKECMRWHIRIHNCKQILLGISFDAGYAPFIDEIVKQEDHNRIIILEGPPTVRELLATGLRVLNFDHVFRSDKLIDRSSASNPVPIVSSGASTWAGVTSFAPPTPATSPMVTKAGSTTTIDIKKSTPTPAGAKPKWIPKPRGLDPAITVNTEVLDNIKRRTSNNKLCNNHYLRGTCSKGEDCVFDHHYKATEEDLKAIAYLTRLNPCTSGQDCENEWCIYGHHCPSYKLEKGELTCNAYGCRFSNDEHPPGTKIIRPRRVHSDF